MSIQADDVLGDYPVDPLVQALTRKEIEVDVAEYVNLLDTEVSEGELHHFLATHSYFFNGLIRLFGVSPLYSKVKLGAEYEADFAFFDASSFGIEWNLIEIEAPGKDMFTKGGNPTAELTHAIQQVRDWHAWIHENLDYARKLMPKIEYPMGHVFIGRRADLSEPVKGKLRRLAHDHRAVLQLHTLDWFAGAAHSTKALLGDNTPGHWSVPMNAFSHSELAAGKPSYAFDVLNNPSARRLRDEYDRDMLLHQRQNANLPSSEFAGELD